MSGFEQGRVIERFFPTVEALVTHRARSLREPERALLAFLKSEALAGARDVATERRARAKRHRARRLPAVPEVWLGA